MLENKRDRPKFRVDLKNRIKGRRRAAAKVRKITVDAYVAQCEERLRQAMAAVADVEFDAATGRMKVVIIRDSATGSPRVSPRG